MHFTTCTSVVAANLDLTREQRGGGGVQICTTPLCFTRIFFAARANFKMRSKPIPSGSNSGCLGVFRVNISLSSTWSELENQGHPRWRNRRFSSGRCNFNLHQHTDKIPVTTPTFSTMADLTMKMSMSPDVVDYGFKMAATKPELEITFQQ